MKSSNAITYITVSGCLLGGALLSLRVINSPQGLEQPIRHVFNRKSASDNDKNLFKRILPTQTVALNLSDPVTEKNLRDKITQTKRKLASISLPEVDYSDANLELSYSYMDAVYQCGLLNIEECGIKLAGDPWLAYQESMKHSEKIGDELINLVLYNLKRPNHKQAALKMIEHKGKHSLVDYYKYLGTYYERTDQPEKAAEVYNEAIYALKDKPQDIFWLQIGLFAYNNGDISLADECFSKEIKYLSSRMEDPKSPAINSPDVIAKVQQYKTKTSKILEEVNLRGDEDLSEIIREIEGKFAH